MIDYDDFVSTIRKNVNNKKLTDKKFRQFIRNTLPIVPKCPSCDDSGIINHGVDGLSYCDCEAGIKEQNKNP